MKVCGKCKEEKDLEEFSKNKSHKDGYGFWCKKCMREYAIKNKENVRKHKYKYADANREQINKKRREYRKKYPNKDKEYYQRTKEIRKEKNKKYREENKNKIKQRDKNYYKNNKEKINIKQKEYYKNNQEKIKQNTKEYNKNNKEKIRAYRERNKELRSIKNKIWYENNKKIQNEKQKERIKNNINFKLAKILRGRLYCALKGKVKVGSAVKDLGCSIEFLKQYLENQFKGEMSWENHGKLWAVDHIIPARAFNLTDPFQFKACCYYENLQPLYREENLSKNGNYEQEDYEMYLEYFKTKMEQNKRI